MNNFKNIPAQNRFYKIKLIWTHILFCWCFNYMTRRKSGGMCPCKSVKYSRKWKLSCCPVVAKKTYFLPLFDNPWAIFSLYHTVVEIFVCLWGTFRLHQQIAIYSSKHFLENVWNDFRKCDTTFIFKRGAQIEKVFNPGRMQFENQELVLDTRVFSNCQCRQICRVICGKFRQFHKIAKWQLPSSY